MCVETEKIPVFCPAQARFNTSWFPQDFRVSNPNLSLELLGVGFLILAIKSVWTKIDQIKGKGKRKEKDLWVAFRSITL